jgi:glycosyltransferase involved in cell wall biosynthesis
MKILLVNEASGLNLSLKKGLTRLGHNVVHANSVDGGGVQQRPFDFYFGNPGSSMYSKIKRNILPFWKVLRFSSFDIVHFVLGITSFSGRFIRYKDLRFFKRNGSLLSYYGVGCDELSLLRVRPDVDSLPCCQSCMVTDALGRGCAEHILGWRSKALAYLDLFDFCTTPVCEYDHCHLLFKNAKHARIPFPISVSEIEFVPAKPKKSPLIIHSPTRRGFKGTHIILAAMERLKERTKDFEFRIVEGLAYGQYLRTMKDADIYVDQVFGESFGVAALENLAVGKIVLSGNSSKAQRYMPFYCEAPIFDASPDPESLAETLFALLQRKDEFEALAVKGRKYVETYHDHVKIAQQFLDMWHAKQKESR